jgi:predicted transcriptional regulator
MPKEAMFTLKLEADLRDAFMAEAEAAHRPGSQIVRDMMRDFIARQQEAREYNAFLERKVEAARAEARAGLGYSNDEVAAEFAERRKALLASTHETDA